MKRQLTLVGILLRKDLRLFWQFAALICVLQAVWQIPALVTLLAPPLSALLRLLIPLSAMLLIMVVCQEDAVVSVKHDWLTRPIPGPTLLLAKCLFALAAIVVPDIVGRIANNLYIGRSMSEALLAGVSSGAPDGTLLLITVGMAFAAVTTSIRQALIVLLSGVAAVAMLSALGIFAGTGVQTWATGSGWVVDRPIQLAILFVAAAILWVQYRHRYTTAARLTIGVALIAVVIFIGSMTWPRIFAVQKMLSPDPAAAALVQVQVAKGCFPTTAVVPTLFSEEQRRKAGPGVIAFETRLIRTNVPPGNLLAVGTAVVTYRIAGTDIRPAHAEPDPLRAPSQWKTTRDGTLTWDDYWLLSKSEFDRLAVAHDVETQINYSLSLTAPAAQARFLADGRRASYAGIGYCSATLDRASGAIGVDCFKAGAQPAQLVASLDNAPEAERKASGYPNFTPAVLTLWGGRHYAMQLHGSGTEIPRVSVTAYRARVHFDRQLVVPGVLGGSLSSCPAP
jgi:hypothetical protein